MIGIEKNNRKVDCCSGCGNRVELPNKSFEIKVSMDGYGATRINLCSRCLNELKEKMKEVTEITREDKVIEEEGIAPYCPCCRSGEWLHNRDGNRNDYCGQCGIKLDWSDIRGGYRKRRLRKKSKILGERFE